MELPAICPLLCFSRTRASLGGLWHTAQIPQRQTAEGSLKLGREQQNFSIGSEVKSDTVMRRNTALNGDFSRHNAFLLPFLHMGKSHAGFQLQTGQNSSCHSAVTSQGSMPQGKVVSQHSTDLVQHHDCSSAPSHVNTMDSHAGGLGRAEAGTSYIQNWNEIKDTLPQNCHASKSSSVVLKGHHSPQYISTSQMSLGESSFSGEPQLPAHSSLATDNIKLHYTHTCRGALIKPPSLLLKTQAIKLWNTFTELEINKLKTALKNVG